MFSVFIHLETDALHFFSLFFLSLILLIPTLIVILCFSNDVFYISLSLNPKNRERLKELSKIVIEEKYRTTKTKHSLVFISSSSSAD